MTFLPPDKVTNVLKENWQIIVFLLTLAFVSGIAIQNQNGLSREVEALRSDFKDTMVEIRNWRERTNGRITVLETRLEKSKP